MWRFLVLFLLCLLAAIGPVWLLWGVLVLYVLLWSGFEVIFITLLIDGYYGYGVSPYPYFTIAAVVLLVLVKLLRPYLSIYNQE